MLPKDNKFLRCYKCCIIYECNRCLLCSNPHQIISLSNSTFRVLQSPCSPNIVITTFNFNVKLFQQNPMISQSILNPKVYGSLYMYNFKNHYIQKHLYKSICVIKAPNRLYFICTNSSGYSSKYLIFALYKQKVGSSKTFFTISCIILNQWLYQTLI